MKMTNAKWSLLGTNKIFSLLITTFVVLSGIASVTTVEAQRTGRAAARTKVAASDWKQARIAADVASETPSIGGLPLLFQASPAAPDANPVIFAYNFNNDHLISFNASAPGTLLTDIPVTGLNTVGGEFLETIDFRASDGFLYGIATFDTGASSRMVRINPVTGAVTSVGGTISALPGLFFGGDINPVANVYREVSNDRGSRRVSPDTGALLATDTNLAYVAGDPNAAITPTVVHVAYSNNTTSPASTTLYGIDSTADTLVRIGSVGGSPASPNTGQLTTIGPLGFNATNFGGFDIQQGTGIGWAALRVGGVSSLYRIDPATGAATLIGAIGNGVDPIDGLTVAYSPTAGNADLSVTKTDNKATYTPGGSNVYTIVVGNAGPDPVVGAVLTDTMPAQFNGTGWTCTSTGGAHAPTRMV